MDSFLPFVPGEIYIVGEMSPTEQKFSVFLREEIDCAGPPASSTMWSRLSECSNLAVRVEGLLTLDALEG